jgi:hypothetical protein
MKRLTARGAARRLFCAALVAILTACGGSSGPVPTATPSGDQVPGGPTSQPDPALNCPRGALESYLQRSSNLSSEFIEVMNTNLATPPNQISSVIDRLSALRNSLQLLAVPACAAEHARALDVLTNDVLSALTEYGRGGALDLVAFVTQTNATFESIKSLEAQLIALYESLPPG